MSNFEGAAQRTMPPTTATERTTDRPVLVTGKITTTPMTRHIGCDADTNADADAGTGAHANDEDDGNNDVEADDNADVKVCCLNTKSETC